MKKQLIIVPNLKEYKISKFGKGGSTGCGCGGGKIKSIKTGGIMGSKPKMKQIGVGVSYDPLKKSASSKVGKLVKSFKKKPKIKPKKIKKLMKFMKGSTMKKPMY